MAAAMQTAAAALLTASSAANLRARSLPRLSAGRRGSALVVRSEAKIPGGSATRGERLIANAVAAPEGAATSPAAKPGGVRTIMFLGPEQEVTTGETSHVLGGFCRSCSVHLVFVYYILEPITNRALRLICLAKPASDSLWALINNQQPAYDWRFWVLPMELWAVEALLHSRPPFYGFLQASPWL